MKRMFRTLIQILIYGLLSLLPVYAEEKPDGNWIEGITLSGLVEVEAGYESIDFADPDAVDEDSSDIVLATVELGVGVEIMDHVSGEVLLLYEEDETEPMEVDEAFILLDGKEEMPFFLKAGKMVLPFGIFESAMVSDPLTLELGESHESAIDIGVHAGGFSGSVYIFNGDMDKEGDDSQMDNWGLFGGYAMATDGLSIDVGTGYVSNLMDSDVLTEALDAEREGMGNDESIELRDYVGGFYAHAVVNVEAFMLIGEFMTATDEPEYVISDGTQVTVETHEKLRAWNMELATILEVAERETVIAIGYQGSDNTEDLLPETRIMGTVGIGLFDSTSLSLEYFHDTFENDDEADVITLQLAIEF